MLTQMSPFALFIFRTTQLKNLNEHVKDISFKEIKGTKIKI